MVVQSRGLRDKYCIVGVGETEYSRGSNRTTRALAVEAVRNAILDAGLTARDVDGMMDYQGGDSTLANHVASDLGIRLNFYMDVMGGGSSTEALVGLAMGAIEAGMCNTVAIYHALHVRRRPACILGVAGLVSKPRLDFHWAHGPITRVAGYYAKDIVFGQAGIGPEDVDVTGSYDAFTFTTMLQLEEYGFCKKGEGGQYVSTGAIELAGHAPTNTPPGP